jgi:hypothetical protein
MKMEKDHGGGTHIFVACTNYKKLIKNNVEFKNKEDDVNQAKYKLALYDVHFKNYI